MENEKLIKALDYAMSYCARGERTETEVRQKLDRFELTAEEMSGIFQNLRSEGFIDHDRFARMYCREKFSQNQWGKIKIRKALERKGLDESSIQKGLQEIDPEAYQDLLKTHLMSKLAKLKDTNIFIRKGKLFRFAAQKGFEPDLIYRLIDEVMNAH